MITMEELADDGRIAGAHWHRCKAGIHVEISDDDGDPLGEGEGKDFDTAMGLALRGLRRTLADREANGNEANRPELTAGERQ